jgi:pimeloyl-ACP methyl ester carboxylesterase
MIRAKRVRLAAAMMASFAALGAAQRLSDFTTPRPMPSGSVLVVGFLGGFERWDDDKRSVRKLALDLRSRGLGNWFAETAANRHRRAALKLITRALDTNGDGRLDAGECAAARIILYGQSLGGAAAVETARDLDRLGVPVLLTVQVDSVGLHDSVIPANVREAVNFYQHDLFTPIHGNTGISAADPSRTRILGNYELSYLFRRVDPAEASWARRKFGGSHTKMELDPALWNRVEHLIIEAGSR